MTDEMNRPTIEEGERAEKAGERGMARKTGQIIRRGDNKFLCRIFLGRDEVTGRRKYHNATVRGTKKDAQRFINGVLREQDLGTFAEPSRMTLSEFLDRWLKESAKPSVSERTYQNYVWLLKTYVRPKLGTVRLSALIADQTDREGRTVPRSEDATEPAHDSIARRVASKVAGPSAPARGRTIAGRIGMGRP